MHICAQTHLSEHTRTIALTLKSMHTNHIVMQMISQQKYAQVDQIKTNFIHFNLLTRLHTCVLQTKIRK